jgi:hypothetical protein
MVNLMAVNLGIKIHETEGWPGKLKSAVIRATIQKYPVKYFEPQQGQGANSKSQIPNSKSQITKLKSQINHIDT